MALGIDLGSFDSKMVELVESSDAVQAKTMGTRPIFSDISAYSTEKLNKSVWSNNIQQLCKEKKISIKKQKQVAFSIPSSKTIFKQGRQVLFIYLFIYYFLLLTMTPLGKSARLNSFYKGK